MWTGPVLDGGTTALMRAHLQPWSYARLTTRLDSPFGVRHVSCRMMRISCVGTGMPVLVLVLVLVGE